MAQLLQPLADMLEAEKLELFKRGDTEAGRKLSERAKQIKNSVDWLESVCICL